MMIVSPRPTASILETRALEPADGRLLSELGQSLSDVTRRLRFFSSAPRTVERWIAALLKADQDHHLAECLLHKDDFGAVLVGVTEVIRTDEPGLGEFAIAVADEWQRLGAGSLLVRRMARRSIEAGIDRWKVDRLADNHTLDAIVRQVGRTVAVTTAYGVVTSEHRLELESGEGGI